MERMAVFCPGTAGGDVAHMDQDVFNGTLSVMASTMVATSTTAPASPNPFVAINSDGRMEVFGVWSDTSAVHGWQTVPNGGWSGWFELGGGGLTRISRRTKPEWFLGIILRGREYSLSRLLGWYQLVRLVQHGRRRDRSGSRDQY